MQAAPKPKGCVLLCDDNKAWAKENFAQMFVRYLSTYGIEWDILEVAAGQHTSINEKFYARYDCFVLTGSRYNCSDRNALPWFDSVCRLIQYVAEHGDKRLYGGCFGHQIVAVALGGTVGKNPTNHFFLMAETIQLAKADDLPMCRNAQIFLTDIGMGSPRVIVSHGDCVLGLPPSHTHLLGSSKSCKHEIYLTGKYENIVCCQSHPEFDYDYCIKERIVPALQNTMTEAEKAMCTESFATFQGRSEGSDQLIAGIGKFLARTK
jgi:GMP synthase-like glutamine amidotransferase